MAYIHPHLWFFDMFMPCALTCMHVFVFFYKIARFKGVRVEVLQLALVQWCEQQLRTAKESADQFNQHLQAFRGLAY